MTAHDDTTHDDTTHDALRASLPELALDILDGRQRATVMSHVENCEECAGELRALSATADALVLVPVAVDPPLGFESRVIERIRRSDPALAHGRFRTLRLAAAAAAIIVAFGVGWTVEHVTSAPSHASATGPLIERSLTASGKTVGSIYVDTGQPSWMFVSLNVPGAPSRIRCEVITSSGRHDVIGTFSLVAGHGAWAKTLPMAWSSVRTVDITTTSGVRIATLGASTWPNSSTTRTK
jgi:hypothetical protein